MAKPTYKQLPVIRRLGDRMCGPILDFSRTHAGAASVASSAVSELLDRIATEFSVDRERLEPMVAMHAGLPATPELTSTMVHTLKSWVPALKAGYRYDASRGKEFSKVPHTLYVLDPEFDPEQGRWSMSLNVVRGPVAGSILKLSVTHRMACSMVVYAIGVRKAYSLDRPRPYDLHGMRLLASLKPLGPTLGIERMMRCPAIQIHNQKYADRLSTCIHGRYTCVCFDCGAGERECGMARHAEPLSVGKCRCCGGNDRKTTVKGVCVGCLKQMMEMGVEPMVSSS